MSPPLRLAVIGHPVAHSRSPQMHTAGLRAADLEGSYEAIDVPPERLAAFLARLEQEGFRGVNVTIPHKRAAAELVHDVAAVARRAGSVNTVLVQPDGRLAGHSTDGQGLLWALHRTPPETALVAGAGGAARAAAAALLDAGCRVAVSARRGEEAAALASELGAAAAPWPPVDPAGLIVNATPVGQAGAAADLPVPVALVEQAELVCDLAYRGDGQTTGLIAAAAAAGVTAVDGLEVLLGQGLVAFSLFTGQPPPVEAMAAAVRGHPQAAAGRRR
jgi:shikimate dehydrogenase